MDPEIPQSAAAGLDADATAPDREMALAAARRVVTQTDDGTPDALLGALDRLVKKKIQSHAPRPPGWPRARLEGLDQRVVADAVAARPDAPGGAIAKEARGRGTGSTESTPELTGRAQVAMGYRPRSSRLPSGPAVHAVE